MRAQFDAFFPSMLSAFSFMVFNLFDSPCLAALSTSAKELHSRKFFWYSVLFQNVSAYCVALIVYQIGGLILGEVSFGIASVFAIAVLALVLFLLFRPDPNKKKSAEMEAQLAR